MAKRYDRNKSKLFATRLFVVRKAKRKLEFVCILALVTVIAAFTSGEIPKEGDVREAEARELWEKLYKKGTDYIYLGKPERAVEPLSEAAKIAVNFPAGDRNLAETYDDLAQAYFRMKEYQKAEAAQGKAVAALVLAEGPDARDLSIFVERFGFATHQSINPEGFPAYTLVGTHTPYDGERFERERETLIVRYRDRGDLQAVEFLESL